MDPSQSGLNAHVLKSGFDQFYAPRQPGDIDLVSMVREEIKQAYINHEVLPGTTLEEQLCVKYDQNRLIMEALDKTPEVQRFQLNRFWLNQLIHSTGDQMSVRKYLIGDGTPEEWFRLFKDFVLPYVVQHHLPIAL